MFTENPFSSEKTLWFGVAVSAIALVSALVYIAAQLADVKAVNKRLLQELAGVQELLDEKTAFQASLQTAESGVPNQLNASDLTEIIRSELDPITQSIANLNAADCRAAAQHPQTPPGMPTLPMAGMPGLASPALAKAKPDSVLPFSSDLPEETRDYVESVFRRNKEEVRRRIAEDTDTQSGQLDPTVLRRIMEQSQEDLMAQLEGVLPQEDFEKLFPRFAPPPPPAASVGGPGK